MTIYLNAQMQSRVRYVYASGLSVYTACYSDDARLEVEPII